MYLSYINYITYCPKYVTYFVFFVKKQTRQAVSLAGLLCSNKLYLGKVFDIYKNGHTPFVELFLSATPLGCVSDDEGVVQVLFSKKRTSPSADAVQIFPLLSWHTLCVLMASAKFCQRLLASK